MSEPLTLLLAWVAGVMLGTLFFYGLRLTVHRGLTSRRPALWFLGSMLLRTGAALAGFYLVSGGHRERLLLCLLGFVMARLAVTRLTPASPARPASPTEEVSHAARSR